MKLVVICTSGIWVDTFIDALTDLLIDAGFVVFNACGVHATQHGWDNANTFEHQFWPCQILCLSY